MAKIVVGPISKGLRNDVTAFNIDNDAFLQLVNAYQWRGRIKRKRGTAPINRLTRYFDSLSTAFNPGTTTQNLTADAGNLITGFTSSQIETSAQIKPGSVTINDVTASITYTDPASDGILVGAPSGSGTINYSTGAFTISGGATNTINANFSYYPTLPVLGLEELLLNPTDDLGCLAFDTTYSYDISSSFPYPVTAVNFYANPQETLPGYTPKTTWTSLKWNGQNYQQFWTLNYENSMWTTNGITFPYSTTNIGMQFKAVTNVVIDTAGPPATATLSIASHGLVKGDFLFLNEIVGITGINFQTCYVIDVPTSGSVQVEFPLATLGGSYTSGGIAQYLTNNADATKDCLRYYTGPSVSSTTPPVFSGSNGWVNFSPPLSNLDYAITGLTPDQYYLVGARMIVNFKDRLLFIGCVVQASSGLPVYLQDTVIYSQNGTPYYTASFNGSPSSTTFYQPLLTPQNQGATDNPLGASPQAFWQDQTGLGGFITAGFQSDINTVSTNEDVLILGFGNKQARFVYTNNDLLPFAFYVINSELGSNSTFSSINLDRGYLSFGNRGVIITSQIESKRIDLDVPDEIFQVSLLANGAQRITAQRDFINEWIYFTYRPNSSNSSVYLYPTQTLFYNYRDGSWAIFKESFTTYGLFRKRTGFVWENVGLVYPTWEEWTDNWESGESTLLQPDVIAGNQQGFVFLKAEGTGEADSLYISAVSGMTITSPDHCLADGDYIIISGMLGSTNLNGGIYQVLNAAKNTFQIDTAATGTYTGGGLIKRMYIPFIQTKQFPVAWDMGRKTRLGPHMYLLTKTANGQCALLIFLSQNASSAYNSGSIVPSTNPYPNNNGLIYSTVLYTCPESDNLGLTPANTNLQMVTGYQQEQIWHRINTSLIGDTIQIGITLNDEQMRDPDFKSQFNELELHSIILDVNPSQLLS